MCRNCRKSVQVVPQAWAAPIMEVAEMASKEGKEKELVRVMLNDNNLGSHPVYGGVTKTFYGYRSHGEYLRVKQEDSMDKQFAVEPEKEDAPVEPKKPAAPEKPAAVPFKPAEPLKEPAKPQAPAAPEAPWKPFPAPDAPNVIAEEDGFANALNEAEEESQSESGVRKAKGKNSWR